MIILDTALKKRQQENRPIQVGLIGAGFMGRGIALQILLAMPGMRLAGVVNRTIHEAERAYRQGILVGIQGRVIFDKLVSGGKHFR